MLKASPIRLLQIGLCIVVIFFSLLIREGFPQTKDRIVTVFLENKNGPPDAIVGNAGEIYEDARLAIESGDYKRAEACYKALIENDQNNPSLHFQLARLYEFNLHLFEAAIKEYRLAEEGLRANDIELKAYYQEIIGQIYLNSLAKPEEAIIAFQDSLRTNPDNIHNQPLLYNLAVALCSAGRMEEGKDYFRKVIQLQPDSNYAYVSGAQLLIFQEDYKGALAGLIKAKEITSDEAFKETIDRAIEAVTSAMQE